MSVIHSCLWVLVFSSMGTCKVGALMSNVSCGMRDVLRAHPHFHHSTPSCHQKSWRSKCDVGSYKHILNAESLYGHSLSSQRLTQALYAHKVCKCTATPAADHGLRRQPFCYMRGERERDGDAERRPPVYPPPLKGSVAVLNFARSSQGSHQ